MKLITIIIMTALLILPAGSVFAQTGTIDLKITGIEDQEGGKLKIGLFDSESYLEFGKEIVGINLDIKGVVATHVLSEIPVGTYVLAVYQDQDSNDKLDKNFFGAPSEPYGFSQNQYGMFGPPDFEDVSFEVKENETTELAINLE